jgi:hypothetical protein
VNSDMSEENQSQTLEDAKAVLIGIATDDEMREEHSLIADFCDQETLGSIVDLAWRLQFTEDRYSFKKGIREIEQHVALKVRQALEQAR